MQIFVYVLGFEALLSIMSFTSVSIWVLFFSCPSYCDLFPHSWMVTSPSITSMTCVSFRLSPFISILRICNIVRYTQQCHVWTVWSSCIGALSWLGYKGGTCYTVVFFSWLVLRATMFSCTVGSSLCIRTLCSYMLKTKTPVVSLDHHILFVGALLEPEADHFLFKEIVRHIRGVYLLVISCSTYLNKVLVESKVIW